MPKFLTRLTLDSSGKQIPPKKKSKPSPTYLMERVRGEVVNRPARIGFIFPWRGLTIFLGTIFLAEAIFFSLSMRDSTGTVVTNNAMKEEEKAVALHPEKEITPITIPSSLENERDPFSSYIFKESARRAELASKKKSFQYSPILKEDGSPNLIASILATPGELPELNLEDVKLEGKPETKERELTCPFSFQGKITRGEEEIFFLSKDEKSYSVRIGEVIEGYKLLSREGDALILSKGSNLFTLPLSYRGRYTISDN